MSWDVVAGALMAVALFMLGYSCAYRFYCPRCGGRDTYRIGRSLIRCRACERVEP